MAHTPLSFSPTSAPQGFIRPGQSNHPLWPRLHDGQAHGIEGTQPLGEAFEDEQVGGFAASSQQATDGTPGGTPSVLLSTQEARDGLAALNEAGIAIPRAEEVENLPEAVANSPAHTELTAQARRALRDQAPVPGSGLWAKSFGQTTLLHRGDAARNVTAYVFFVMLEAQKEATQEKRDALRAMKMHAGMLEDLNLWLSRVVLPAQRSLNAKIKAGHLKDSLSRRKKQREGGRENRVEELVGMPQDVDTTWGATDPDTGRVYIPALREEATLPTKVDAQDLTALIAQTDQWRTTLQNNQNRESMEFKRLDDAMSSGWQQLSGFLKAAQEGANAIIRNGVG